MNVIDKTIAFFSPQTALKRFHERTVLAAYDAAKPNKQRKERPDNASANLLTLQAGSNIRGYARNLEQNYDIAESVLKTMVNNVIGANGISIEPIPRKKDGTLHTDFAKQLLKYWNDWKQRPEVTWELRWSDCERLLCRTWLRDGEALIQVLAGTITTLDHGTKVPLSIELIEADYLPTWNNGTYKETIRVQQNGQWQDITNDYDIIQSIERNRWGRARAYHVLKQHPHDVTYKFNIRETRRIPAQNILHLKLITRFKQSRGVSIFATVMKRLEDIKDYEESERIAARVAAAMTAYIKRETPEDYSMESIENGQRDFKMSPGMIYDQLSVGEDIGTIQSNRPSGLLSEFRDAMVRAVSGGTGANYSSVSKKYDGNYSAQRQELVESYANYAVLTDSFAGMVTLPLYKRVIETAILTGVIKVPKDIDIDTIFEAEFYGPKMPWVDPLKEIRANQEAVSAGFKSSQQVIRDSGNNPEAVLEQTADWKTKAEDKGLSFTTQPQQPTQM